MKDHRSIPPTLTRDKHIQEKASQTSKPHAKGKAVRQVPAKEAHFQPPAAGTKNPMTDPLAGIKEHKTTSKRQPTLPNEDVFVLNEYDPLGRPDGARQKSIEKLKEYLLTRRAELRRFLSKDNDQMEDESMQGDMVDLAVTTVRTEQSFQRVEAVSQELSKVERAIDRIDKHIYGRCEVCDGMIPIARLRALPFAEKCVICQSAAEANRASLGGGWTDSVPDATWSAMSDEV